MVAPRSDAPARFVRGYRWQGRSAGERRAVIEAAFDYRGDVTLILRGGKRLEGYVANRDFDAAEPFVQVFPKDGGPPERVACAAIEGVEFTGKDAAAGRSFATWLEKYQDKKAAEARGEGRPAIDLYPEALE